MNIGSLRHGEANGAAENQILRGDPEATNIQQPRGLANWIRSGAQRAPMPHTEERQMPTNERHHATAHTTDPRNLHTIGTFQKTAAPPLGLSRILQGPRSAARSSYKLVTSATIRKLTQGEES
jgi:hypothetical protein